MGYILTNRYISIIKKFSPSAIRDVLGALYDYIYNPALKDCNYFGFNGQAIRQKIFADLMAKCKFLAAVETGTFLGNTTEFIFENTDIPVYTCEIHRRYYLFSKLRFAGFGRCHIFRKDSRDFLDLLKKSSSMPKSRVFFYLDAHWHEDLPLLEEVSLICQHWSDSIIMIDDFAVPDDSGYKYDCYGKSKTLNLDYLSKSITAYNLQVWFPSGRADQETRSKRGCVILSTPGNICHELHSISSIRKYDFRGIDNILQTNNKTAVVKSKHDL